MIVMLNVFFFSLILQVLARPVAAAAEGKGDAVVSDEALSLYTSEVLKALYSAEISKQLGMDR